MKTKNLVVCKSVIKGISARPRLEARTPSHMRLPMVVQLSLDFVWQSKCFSDLYLIEFYLAKIADALS